MIRFIDIRDGVYPLTELEECTQFSWWDTVTGSFEEFNQKQMWDSWKEFEEDFWVEVEQRKDWPHQIVEPEEHLARFKRLYPKGKP